MADRTEIIGEWIEQEPRYIRQCPSYYAADWEVLHTVPGRYPLIATFHDEPGQRSTHPYYVGAKVDAERIAGKTYSGFGGLNFASTDLPLEPKPYHVQLYGYQLVGPVDRGAAVVAAEFQSYVDYSREFTVRMDADAAARRAASEAHHRGEPHDTNPEVCNPCWSEGRQRMWDAHRFGDAHDEEACDHCKLDRKWKYDSRGRDKRWRKSA